MYIKLYISTLMILQEVILFITFKLILLASFLIEKRSPLHLLKLTMLNHGSVLLSCILFVFMQGSRVSCGATDENRLIHVVYMGQVPQGEYSASSHHLSILEKVVHGSYVADSFIRSYQRSFNGFAANITTREGQMLADMKEVISIFPSTTLKLQTTRSWDFMGFHETVERRSTEESDVIIGVIDTGIWPELESFGDQGFGPAPKKWKGACEGGKNFTCNNKIIGARYYSAAYGTTSARDVIGHGSHTASIAAGNKVKDVSFYGLAQGTARGGVPSARIAAYKVCHPEKGCDSADILAAFDDAIADGVDIITISIGSEEPISFDRDVISIGAFHAMEKAILTVQSAGNGICGTGTVTSIAPWVLTVAASSTDRKFIDKITLGDGTTLMGRSINSFTLNGTMFPLIHGKEVSRHCSEIDAQSCKKGCVDSDLVKGKIVLCDLFEASIEAYEAGALGAIVLSTLSDDDSVVVPLPASVLSSHDYLLVKGYVNSTKNPEVKILKSEVIKDLSAPTVASFSTCGPNAFIPEIMKPDVTAPGIDILAAYSPIASLSDGPLDKRRVRYNIDSGTSMSCPHAAGLAAYVKSFHPDWSPSAIKSAIMTTAWSMDTAMNLHREFSYGSGHINPAKATVPGLVYDADKEDYIKLLCRLGFGSYSLRRISGDNSTCQYGFDKALPIDFNYPSITFHVSPKVSFRFKFNRTVTNVGFPNSTYWVKVIPNHSINVQVLPKALSFKYLHQKQSFVVIVKGNGLLNAKMVSTSLVWSDGTHSLRTPVIAVALNQKTRL